MFKKVRNIFFGTTSVLTILPLVSVSSNKLLIAENNNKKIQYINLNSAYVKAQADESDEGRTINLGAYTYKTTRKNVEVAITYVTQDQEKNIKI